MAQLRQRRSGTAERIEVLEELQSRQEGVGAGVKEVLTQARAARDGPLRDVCGMLADLIHVTVEIAPLIEVALGPITQHLVATRGSELVEYLQRESPRLVGRVGFLWLDG